MVEFGTIISHMANEQTKHLTNSKLCQASTGLPKPIGDRSSSLQPHTEVVI